MPYKYGLLSIHMTPEAQQANHALLGPTTLGIEVTNQAFASLCGLGNIDPQHSGTRDSSAIEEALVCTLPNDGSTLVTIRPDRDSYGAMAILMIRADGMDTKINRELVSWIGAVDRVGLEKARVEFPELLSEKLASDAVQTIISVKDDQWATIEDQIKKISLILIGAVKRPELQDLVFRLDVVRKAEPRNFPFKMVTKNLAYIIAPGKYQQARDWGNSRFRVALVFDPQAPAHAGGGTYKKWTLVRKPKVFDREGFERVINAYEARARGMSVKELTQRGFAWGGTQNIVSSPQGVGRETVLTEEDILEVVQRHLESGIVS